MSTQPTGSNLHSIKKVIYFNNFSIIYDCFRYNGEFFFHLIFNYFLSFDFNYFLIAVLIFFIPYPFSGNELTVAFIDSVKKVIPALEQMQTPDVEDGVNHDSIIEVICLDDISKVRIDFINFIDFFSIFLFQI